jgi:hypothetical protein
MAGVRLKARLVEADQARTLAARARRLLDFDQQNLWRCRNKRPAIRNNAALGGINLRGEADVDPWIFSAGFGYRFNLGDLFGPGAETAYIK